MKCMTTQESNMSPVSKDRFDDLKETMTTRFDELQRSLVTLESKEHHTAEINHLDYRVTDLEDKLERYHKEEEDALANFKAFIWKAVSLSSSMVAFVTGIIQWLIVHN